MYQQMTFSPMEHGFKFVGDWYEFDYGAAHKAALKARNAEARRLRKEGQQVRCWTLRDQLVSRGGIGSGHPHISLVVNVYGLNVM